MSIYDVHFQTQKSPVLTIFRNYHGSCSSHDAGRECPLRSDGRLSCGEECMQLRNDDSRQSSRPWIVPLRLGSDPAGRRFSHSHDCPFANGLECAERDKRRGKQSTADDQGLLSIASLYHPSRATTPFLSTIITTPPSADATRHSSLRTMHATERRRPSTCSTDNGSSHSHDHARLTHVVSNLSTMSDSPKHKHVESGVSVSTSDANPAYATQSPSQMQSQLATNPSSSPSSNSQLSAAAAVHLNTLLTTGQRKSWKFAPNDTIDVVRSHIWNNWPASWPQPRPESAAYLRLLHLGHILDDPKLTLASRGCKPGATTVVHIIIRSIPPPLEPVKVEQEAPVKTTQPARPPARNRQQEDTPGCSCVIC